MNNFRFEHGRWLILALLVSAFALPSGCARRTRRGVQVVVAGQMNCPPQQLRSYAMGGQRFRVEGCGMQGTFECYRRGRRSLQCNAVEGPAPVGGGYYAGGQQTVQVQVAPAPQAYVQPGGQPWTPELGQQVFDQSAPHVLSCVPAPTPISLELTYGMDGRVSQVGGLAQFSPPQQACLNSAIQYASVPGGLTQAVVVPIRFR